ncbi:MAG: CRISPR-associated protein Cas4 [Bacteroidia bacterium]|nr:CRISPR-associated protein Cas4 [Bacteroidia bacterium]
MNITGTQIAYLHLCHRKLWLFANGLEMEHSSELVAEGRLIGETSYAQRPEKWQEIAVAGIKIDHYDSKNGIVREVKKSRKRDDAHIAQLKYYLYVLEQHGIKISHGVLEYPKLRQTDEVWLSEEDRANIPLWEKQVREIVDLPECPVLIKKKICKKCAYHELCYIGEI